MNPKEKSAYLVVKYMSKVVSKQVAKECALVAVDAIIEALKDNAANSASWLYYGEVKQEIEKI